MTPGARLSAALLAALVSGACRQAARGSDHDAERATPRSVPVAAALGLPLGPPAAAPGTAASTAPPSRPPGALRELTWRYPGTALGPSEVVVAIPDGTEKDTRFPVLVAFHGRGESLRGPRLGARGWLEDYALATATRRLMAPPLLADDLLGFVTEAHLRELNAGLVDRPFQGLIVVCPYLPDVLRGGHGFEDGKALAHFIVDELLPRVYRETPAIGTPSTTSVDGVSLGGRAALMVGLERPGAFGAVGALQPAIDDEEASRFADLSARARTKNPSLVLRLLTSDGDYFLDATRALGRALSTRGVPHRLDVVVGPHSYEFNRGPGVYEMLLFHDTALRQPSPGPRGGAHPR